MKSLADRILANDRATRLFSCILLPTRIPQWKSWLIAARKNSGMSHHLSLPQSASVPPNPSFSAWLKNHALLFIGQIIGVTSAIASLIYYVEGIYEHTDLTDLNRHLVLWFDWAHLLF
jgi:hypothetical protein